MWRKLLSVLADPDDGLPLTLVGDDGTDPIVQGELVSPAGARYPIIRGIPRFVDPSNYAGSFGLQWNKFAKVQLDSFTGLSHSRQRFDAEVCWAGEIAGRWVLDAGCGSGRFAEVAAGYGADVIAVDLSSAVEAAMDNLGEKSNVHVIQADINRLPLRREMIRYVYSTGVLQHTPNPVASARKLLSQLPPGGRFCFTIYGRKPWTKLFSKYWFRPVTRRVAPDRLLRIIEDAMPVLYPVTTVLYSIPYANRVFQFLIPVANYVDMKDLPRSLRYQEAVLNTFDMLSPRYDNPITAGELTRGLAEVPVDTTMLKTIPVVACGVRK
jgi:SAM-dependent methyltransferase